jgi:hypothetical protein
MNKKLFALVNVFALFAASSKSDAGSITILPVDPFQVAAHFDSYDFSYSPETGWNKSLDVGGEDFESIEFAVGKGDLPEGTLISLKYTFQVQISAHQYNSVNFSGMDHSVVSQTFAYGDVVGGYLPISETFSSGFDSKIFEVEVIGPALVGYNFFQLSTTTHTEFDPSALTPIDPSKNAAFSVNTWAEIDLLRVEFVNDRGATAVLLSLGVAGLALVRNRLS